MAINLSQGVLELMCAPKTDDAPYQPPVDPVLQVYELRQVLSQQSHNTTERYRLMLSDGVQLQQGMLATQRNDLVRDGKLSRGSIIRLSQYVCNVIQQRSIIIIIDLEVVMETYELLGNPKLAGGARPTAQVPSPAGQTGMTPTNAQYGNPLPSGNGPTSRPSGNSPQIRPEHGAQMQSYGGPPASNQDSGRYNINSGPTGYPKQEFAVGNTRNAAVGVSYGGFQNSRTDVSPAPANSYPRSQQPPYQQQPPMYMNRGPVARNEAAPRIIPIAGLNFYQSRWTIKARVTTKSELRHYTNPRGEGKVFSFDLLDVERGEIRVTCFNAVADQFYNQIEAGKVYLISKGSVRPAQKNFNHLQNEYEIHLDTTSLVQPCLDDGSIPMQQFHFKSIGDIEGLENNSVIDLIGVVSSISPSASIMRKNGTETQKRSLHLKDMSGRSVELTLWGNFCNAEGQRLQNMCDAGNFPVLAVKAARVNEFNGKAVGTIGTSQLFIEPDFPEAQRLKEWFDKEGRNAPSVSISREMTSVVRNDVRKTISDIKDEKLGTSEKPDWITVFATLSFMKSDNFCYAACPILIGDRQCNKKVINNGDGKWRCDRCDQSVDEPDYRYILQFQIQDHTGVTWVTAFQEAGEEILGLSAKSLFQLKHEEGDEEKVREIIQEAVFRKYMFKLKVKEETFNDEQRVKSTVVKAEKINFAAETRFLFGLMDKLKVGVSGALAPKPEVTTPVKPGINIVGTGQPSVSGISAGTNTGLTGREMGISSNHMSHGNQYSGGYGVASGTYTTCSSCGGTGHSATNCPSIINGPGQSSGAYFNQTPIGATAGTNSGQQCFKCNKFGHLARECPGLSAVPPAYGSTNVGPGRYGGVQRQHVGGF